MMTTAYDKLYLSDAMDNLGSLFDQAMNRIGVTSTVFTARFLASGIADAFSRGDLWCICGHSGAELACIMMEKTEVGISGNIYSKDDNCFSISSKEYWAGYYLAYYQWQSGLSFRKIFSSGVTVGLLLSMYGTLHEADVSVFVQRIDDIVQRDHAVNQLKRMRKLNALTQEELSNRSGVPIRLIRAYEQGSIKMSNAESGTVARIAKALRVPSASLI